MRRVLAFLLMAWLACWLASSAWAGGPYSCAGAPLKYGGAGTISLNYDQGNLGGRSKATADALVSASVGVWTDVPTATVALLRGPDLASDVTVANYASIANNSSDGLNPVIYDTDGSIVDTIFGNGAKSSVLGFAGSHYVGCQFTEGLAVINGFITVSDTTLKIVMAHEVGHMIGMDHTQLDNEQGLTGPNYPLMYPIAYRSQLSLHEDEVAAVSTLYPGPTFSSAYGQLSGTFTQAGGAPVLGANLWARENTTGKLYSIVSDFLLQNTGYFKLSLPAGTYTLRAGAIRLNFNGGSSVGPYADLATDPSFQAPMYVSGVRMTPVTLGNGSPIPIVITPGCVATASFAFNGTGSVGGNCGTSHLVSFNSNGGSSVNTQVVPFNGTATLPVAPTKPNSTFAGWYADAGLLTAFNFSTIINANITLYAKWRRVDLTPIFMLLLD